MEWAAGIRGLETLKLRMTCHMNTLRRVGDFLARHAEVQPVHYFGHRDEQDEQWWIYRRQCTVGTIPATVRLSIGVEHPEVLIADLGRAHAAD
jgi:cystathionine beta-lyase/cystathionine gamma-synthase